VRATRKTPKERRRPIPKTGANCRGSFAGDIGRELREGRDVELLEQGIRRRALRWDDYAMDLGEAIGDVLNGKPWTVEQEERARGAFAKAGAGTGRGRPPPSVSTNGHGSSKYTEGYEFLFEEES
jgi:hypothetical protein